jgi:hypothetical protein
MVSDSLGREKRQLKGTSKPSGERDPDGSDKIDPDE